MTMNEIGGINKNHTVEGTEVICTEYERNSVTFCHIRF